jgi:hypothetical protein
MIFLKSRAARGDVSEKLFKVFKARVQLTLTLYKKHVKTTSKAILLVFRHILRHVVEFTNGDIQRTDKNIHGFYNIRVNSVSAV